MKGGVYAALPLPYKGKETVFDRPSTLIIWHFLVTSSFHQALPFFTNLVLLLTMSIEFNCSYQWGITNLITSEAN